MIRSGGDAGVSDAGGGEVESGGGMARVSSACGKVPLVASLSARLRRQVL